ncbi:aminotransferase class V-fold PLP-dependent enzyme [Porifericola rhodea]|uniref:aminotransferase class V-fold PLP-dependent enzyme n=1 Tax=Porifericola rhodea TaxID=930972 RepID=UPI00266549DE|nr:aminotransferase class V-fold PLP-dependent enzyme [Porifericola rhodea]WKN32089.1 aminotransferase class V-fold PLP-dependent enzyme [Porifericola rhodea]
MKVVSFYPGPSKVYPEVPTYVREAYEQGLLSANHRSHEFVAVSSAAITLLKTKLHIPDNYSVFFASSATECWEIISQSLVRQSSFHVYNGAFGEKWFSYAQKLQPHASAHTFDINELLDVDLVNVAEDTELIALTHNETSNGTALNMEQIAAFRQKYPQKLLAVDATSSMAGVELDFTQADVWYASVQKCFGLPAGMAILLCSPQALEQAAAVNEKAHYNSLLYMQQMMDKWQTTYTPNVLNIYLLMRVMEARPDIAETEALLRKRYVRWLKVLQAFEPVNLLVDNEEVRSLTVLPFQSDEATIDKLRTESRKKGLVFGNGYGQWKKNSLRIANFPAIEEWEIEKLIGFIQSF